VRLGNILLFSFLVLIGIFLTAPILLILIGSLTASDYIHFPPDALSLKHYQGAAGDDRFVRALGTSFISSIGSATISVLIAMPTSVGLTRYDFKGKGLIQAVLMSPLMIPALVIGITLLHFYAALRLPATVWMIVAGHVVITLPFALRLMMASLAGLDKRLELAAVSLGASPMKAFIQITLPNMRAGLLGAFVFAAIVSFDDIGLSLFIAPATRPTLPVAIFTYLDQNYDPMILAVSSVMILISAVAVLVLDRVIGLSRVFVHTRSK
jgi:putative spermidine/putrescine transport system permease protein